MSRHKPHLDPATGAPLHPLPQSSAATEVLDFLNSIEGAGYGGMASFEIARQYVREMVLNGVAQPAPEPVKDDLPLTEVVARLRAIVADHGGLMHEIEPVDAILCPDCGANLAAEHHKSGWCPSVGVLPRSSAASVSPLIWNALEQALDRLEWLEAYKAGKRNMLPPADAVIPLLKAAQKAALTLAAPQAASNREVGK